MFAQTIRGKVSDPAAVRPVMDRWMRDLGPSAIGWLGSTSGVTEDGQLFVLVRFDSEEAAKANSDSPEQGAWWSEMAKLFDGEATFHDSTDVTVETLGDLDSAGFVQVILGKVSDPERVKQVMANEMSAVDARPDIVGRVSVGYNAGEFAYVIYFTSEEAAREGERKEMPPEATAAMEEMMSLSVGPQEYLDLKTPWLDSPT